MRIYFYRYCEQVRKCWKAVEGLSAGAVQSEHRVVIESVLRGAVDAWRMDATQLSVSVPDLLLRDCAQQLQQVRAEPVLNAESLLILCFY